jgi:asparagine synthetase B (glutamine-hydrolysing)
MCGIAGVRSYGNVPIYAEELKMLLCSLEHRGPQATGIALLTAGRVHILKKDVPAWSFVGAKETDEFLEEFLTPETTIALLHTRFATVGNPETNANNHPLFRGDTAIVHNGSINNHHLLFNNEKIERNCETDSDIIRGLLDKNGLTEEGIKSLNQMSGSAAIAAISEHTPDTLLLARSGSPLTYGTSRQDDKLWWASEMGAIQAAVKPWTDFRGLKARATRTDVSYFGMPDNTAYLLTSTDELLRRPFNSCSHYNAPDYSGTYKSYGSKRKHWRDESRRQKSLSAGTVVGTVTPPGTGYTHKIAPCLKCGKGNKIPKGTDFAGYVCVNKKCKASLAPLDKISPENLTWEN